MVNSKGQSLGIHQPQSRLPSLMPCQPHILPSSRSPHSLCPISTRQGSVFLSVSPFTCICLCLSPYTVIPRTQEASVCPYLKVRKTHSPIREAISFFPEIHKAGPATTGGLIITKRFEVECGALCEGRGELEY